MFKKRYRIRASSFGLLQRLIFCGGCNRPMTPSYSYNHQKKRYNYYRCTSTLSSEKGKSKCPVKYVRFEHVEKKLMDTLLSLSEELSFNSIEHRAIKHNQNIDETLFQMKDSIDLTKNKHSFLKDKKDSYLDSLISGKFTSKERTHINKRLEDMEVEEKQIKGQLMKLEFEIVQKEDEKVDLTNFKHMLITFKTDFEMYSGNKLRDIPIRHNTSIRKHIFHNRAIGFR